MKSLPEQLRVVIGDAIRPGGLALTEKAAIFCDFGIGHRIVDVGSGFGATGRYLRDRFGCRVFNIDAVMRNLSGNGHLPFIRGSAESLPIATGSMDGIFCECVLSQLPFPEKALDEFFRVLRPSGFLIISDLYLKNPVPEKSPVVFSPRSCLTGVIGKTERISQVTGCGFSLEMWEDHSDALKAFVARLVWELGSRASLDRLFCTGGAFGPGLAAIQQARPGYYLMIARKTESMTS